ncbi:hypothetical protein OGH69_07390 [Flavobacterium sp. MFBS3-15]|uniref:hypothetical protein n=1 Tax=Flavobacterium sp. MFBS3-15 TaxID=2989816 RepID=UPI00223558F7|nr:hypothetical protein [Flavobacterium sp. MFBS3-15]MCW4468779.1 hypothetical protein [Flavobacterium sp. MFBS3-15]
MKQLYILLTLISYFNFHGQVSKRELEAVLEETLLKARNAVPTAENSWRYDNTNQDYFKSDTIVLNTARSYIQNYCKEIRWSFYEKQSLVLENTPECTEPPTMLLPTKNDSIHLKCKEKNNDLFLTLKNHKGVTDKFKVIELRRNKPIESEWYAYDYTLILARIKVEE